MADKPYTMTGEVITIGEVQEISDKFSKRLVVLDSGGDYPKPIAFEFGNKQMEDVPDVPAGTRLEVSFYLNGYQGQKDPSYYGVSLRGVECKIIAENNDAAVPEVIEPKVWKVMDDEFLPF